MKSAIEIAKLVLTEDCHGPFEAEKVIYYHRNNGHLVGDELDICKNWLRKYAWEK